MNDDIKKFILDWNNTSGKVSDDNLATYLELDWVMDNCTNGFHMESPVFSWSKNLNFKNNEFIDGGGYDYTDLYNSMNEFGWKESKPLLIVLIGFKTKYYKENMEKNSPDTGEYQYRMGVHDGHHRLVTASLLGIKKIPITLCLSVGPINLKTLMKVDLI